MRFNFLTSVVLTLAVLACRGEGQDGGGGASPVSQGAPSIEHPQTDNARTLDLLIDSLRYLPGQFVLLPENRWSFVGANALFAAFVPFADSGVVRLVDCLDAPGEGAATVDGRKVPIGVLCTWALRRVASFEWGEADEVNGRWPGAVEPTATRQQLEAAGRAWRPVVEQHRYRLN